MKQNFRPFQASAVPTPCVNLREVRTGDLHTERPLGHGRRRLLLGVLQRGHRSLLEAGKTHLNH